MTASTATAAEIIAPGERYDRANEIQHREDTRKRFKNTYRRNADLIIALGLALGFTAPNGNEYRFSVNEAGALTFGIEGSSPVGLASIAFVESVESGLEGSIASVTASITAAYQLADTALQANISTEATTRANADTAIATTVTTLTATVASNHSAALAAVSTEATARATADSAEATARTTADATLTTALGVTNANVTNEISARVSADAALATRASALEASVDTPTTGLLARMTTVEAAYVAGDTAIAASVTSLTAVVSAKVTTFRQSGTPTATAIGDLWYDTGNGNALKRATATGTGNWVATDNAQIATNTADITTNASAISTLSGSVGTLTTTVSAHTSSISTINGSLTTLTASVSTNATAITNLDGRVSAFYGISVNAGTNVATFVLLASGGGNPASAIILTASTVTINGNALVNGTVTASHLNVSTLSAISANCGTITAGNITCDILTTGTLNVDRIAANAITQAYVDEQDSNVDVSTSWVDLASVSVVVPDSTTLVKVDFSIHLQCYADSSYLLGRLVRDSTEVYLTTLAGVSPTLDFAADGGTPTSYQPGFYAQVAGFDSDTPGAAGTYTYTLQVQSPGASGNEWIAAKRRLYATRFRK